MFAVSLGDWELGNSGLWEEPFLPATALRRLKTARGFEQEDRLLQVACQVLALAQEMTEDALRDASNICKAMNLGVCPLPIPHSQLRFLGPPCFRGTAKMTEGNGGFGCI